MSDEVDLRVALAMAQNEAEQARRDVKILLRRVRSLEELSGLNSASLVTRALTVWGYYLLGSLIVSLPVVVTVFVLSAILSR